MHVITIARARQWVITTLVVVAVLVTAALTTRVTVGVPIADGTRTVALILAALLPAVSGVVLVDRFPRLSPTFLRERRLRTVELTGFWIANVLGIVITGQGSVPYRLYTVTSGLLLADISLVLVSWLGMTGVLGSCLAGVVWIIGAGGLAQVLGYPPDLLTDPNSQVLAMWVRPLYYYELGGVVALGLAASLRHVLRRGDNRPDA
ncbi:hypothetical protein [Cutibacterium granulosum]|uniref:Uncharacterized protein n=1 Tax=Cutibacterium granulosum DSM 20700 TaxID=1160719 RepID=U1F3C6_9ACTN|nr:hypothetical protein [Cutibacterium granulosum]ERF58447.1 hypothetical protein H641_00472 [Cutibacterium granulosum DSM 20700]